MARKRYLTKTPLIEAREMFLEVVNPNNLAVEEIVIDEAALDRITAEPIFAQISSPHYHASAMDGICVRAEDTFGATEFVGKTLRLAISDSPGPASFKYVDTGNAMPPWANAVIMIEKVHQVDNQNVEIFESVAPWNHVRLVGEDVVATELLLPRAHRLRPYDLGALLAAGTVSAAGLVGFVGLLVPHLVRLAGARTHRVIIGAAALAGASLVVGADLIARVALPPAELPLGAVTALIGVPFFLALLRRLA